MECKDNDHRACHRVHRFEGFGYCVKWQYKGYEISLATNGEETFIFNSEGFVVWEEYGTGALAIANSVAWIDEQTS